MLLLRVITPPDRTDAVLGTLHAAPGATAITVVRGAALEPSGDLVTAEIAREAANDVVHELDRLDLPRDGTVSLSTVETVLSDAAERAERDAPGLGQDAVIWAEIEKSTGEDSQLSWTFLAFLVIATLIAAVGVLLDQPILIVGAMVVGPEFGPLAALCVGLVHRNLRLALGSVRALLVGFPVAIAITLGLTALARLTGLVEVSMLDRTRPLTDFISHPDAFSFIVAFLASVAGILSLTSAKSGALIGVLISVTTVPAAGNAAVALALGEPGIAGGAALQLLVNLAGIVAAGMLTLTAQRIAWHRR